MVAGENPTDEGATGERRFPDASRRTYFAEERTLLAWWRSGIAAAAVALGVGAILPKLGDEPRSRFIALGVGYGLLAVVFIVGGSLRERQSRRALAANEFAEVPSWVIVAVTVYLSLLVALTVAAVI